MGRERGEGLEGAIGPHVPWISIAANSPVGSTGIIPRPGGTTEERSVFGDCTSTVPPKNLRHTCMYDVYTDTPVKYC